jgi:pilus assembly protein CpaB
MKNRTIIGIICLVLALLVTFVVAPYINRITKGTEEIVIVRDNIKQGAQITENMVDLVAFPKGNVPKMCGSSIMSMMPAGRKPRC